MIDQHLARLRTHRNNISRYRRLLKTLLTDYEREFIERRLAEEQSAFRAVAGDTFPLTFRAFQSSESSTDAAPKTNAGVEPHGLMPGQSRSSQDFVTLEITAN